MDSLPPSVQPAPRRRAIRQGGSFFSLTWEQWLILALAAVILVGGLRWGLPSAHRVRLLLGDQSLTPRERELISTVRDARRHEREALVQERARSAFLGRPATTGSPRPLPVFLTEEDRLDAFCKFLIHSSAADEEVTYSSLSRINLRRLDLAPRYFLYGGSYLYPIGAVLVLLKGSRLVHTTSDYAYYAEHPSQMALIYTVGRGLNVLAFLGTLVLLAWLGARLRSRTAGTMAMLTYGLSTLALDQCLVSKPHVYAAFWGFLGVVLAVVYLDRGSSWLLAGSVFAVGWATGASLPCAVMALIYPALLCRRDHAKGALVRVALAWAGIVLMYILTNPFVFQGFDKYLLMVRRHASADGYGYAQPAAGKLVAYVTDVLVPGYSFPLSVVGLLVLLVSVVGGRGIIRRLAVGSLAILLVMGACLGVPRITLFVGPLVSLFAGFGIAWLVESSPILSRRVRIGLVILLWLPAVVFAALFARDVVGDEAWYGPTREWVESAGIGPATTIGFFGLPFIGQPDSRDTPPFPFLRARLVNLGKYMGDEELPDYVIVGVFEDNREKWAAHPLRPRYRLSRALGYRRSYDWALPWRIQSQSRIAAWIYEPSTDDGR